MFQIILNKLKAILTPKKEENDCELTERQITILKDLLRLRTATLSKFEIETNQLGKGLESELSELEKTGWIESHDTGSELEPKVYHVSAKAFKLLRFDDKKEGLTVSIRVKYPLYTAYTPQRLSDFCCGDYPPNRETQVWVNKDGFVIDAPFVNNYWRNIFLEDFPITVYVLDRDTSLRTEAYDANNERKAFLESRIRKQMKREWE
jgi:hypothetical protein